MLICTTLALGLLAGAGAALAIAPIRDRLSAILYLASCHPTTAF
jgi:hypothetical protein